MRSTWLTVVLTLLACACGEATAGRLLPDGGSGDCACRCWATAPSAGQVTLLSRMPGDRYDEATFSFKHATAADSDFVRNDWDLLFGNDREPQVDLFSVNMVTDDTSFIVDLGEVGFRDIPQVVQPSNYALGVRGRHDELPVRVGHVYVVRTVDEDTLQYAAFVVTEHELDHSVTIQWFRSVEPNRFVLADL